MLLRLLKMTRSLLQKANKVCVEYSFYRTLSNKFPCFAGRLTQVEARSVFERKPNYRATLPDARQ